MDLLTTKICNKCKQEKDISKFSKNKNHKGGISYYCSDCIADYKKISRKIKEPKFILCHYCNKEIGVKGLPWHLKKLHDIINFKSYVRDHLEEFKQYGWQWCDNCRTELARNFASSKKDYATCSRKCRDEYRSKLWEENKSHPWLGRKHSKESIEKMRTSQKEYFQTHEHPSTGTHLTKEEKENLSQKAKERYKNPEYYNKFLEINKKQWADPEYRRKMFTQRTMYTKLELNVAKLLKDNNYDFDTQFSLYDQNRYFLYDFKLKNYSILIEADGDYWHGGPGVKKHWKSVEQNKKKDQLKNNIAKENNYKVVRIWESEMKTNPELLIDRIKAAIEE